MDESAERFAQVYDEHVGTVYGFFAYRLGSREDAEYLTRQTFEHALEAWDGFDAGLVSPSAWLLTIARNLLGVHGGTAEPSVEGVGADPQLEAAVARLNDREREVLALRFGADLSGAEIGGLTGLGVTDVQRITSLSLRRLQGEVASPAR